MSEVQFAPAHLRALLEREQRAARVYDELRANTLIEIARESAADYFMNQGAYSPRDPDHAPDFWDNAWWLDAHVTVTPKVIRARQRWIDARIEREMAEHLLAGHLLDADATPPVTR